MMIGYALYTIQDSLVGDKAFERWDERRLRKIREMDRREGRKRPSQRFSRWSAR